MAISKSANYNAYFLITDKSDIAVAQAAAVASNSCPTSIGKMVVAKFTKSGAGKGAVKLQGSVDGVTWTDLAGAPAASTVAAGDSSAVMYSVENPFPMVQVLFTEDNTGTATITQVVWSVK